VEPASMCADRAYEQEPT